MASNNVAEELSPEDRYRYCDDLTILEIVCLGGLLTDYDCLSHVPSDVSVNQKFLPPQSFTTQSTLINISEWTVHNKMLLNPSKTNFMIFTRSKEEFTTRLVLDNQTIKRQHAIKLCGVWLTPDLSFSRHCDEV